MKTIILIATVTLVLVNVNAQNFNSLDLNDDKIVDRNEYATNAKIFDKWDDNNDTKLSQDEFLNAIYKIFDANTDNVVGVTEWQKSNRLIQAHKNGKDVELSKWDEDGNKIIDKGEFSSNLNKVFKKWDNNGDNNLAKSEFYDNSFKWWDLDNNGSISEDEFKQVKDLTSENAYFWENLF